MWNRLFTLKCWGEFGSYSIYDAGHGWDAKNNRITGTQHAFMCLHIIITTAEQQQEQWWGCWGLVVVGPVRAYLRRQAARALVCYVSDNFLTLRSHDRSSLPSTKRERKKIESAVLLLSRQNIQHVIHSNSSSLSVSTGTEGGRVSLIDWGERRTKQKNERWWDNIIILQRKGPASPT